MRFKDLFRLVWLWLPVSLQMGVIFYYSSQPSGSDSLESFPLPAGIGHFGGYGLLALLLYRALNKEDGWLKWRLRPALIAIVISALYGAWDEFYQGFIPGRESTVVDVIIDTAGAVTAMAVLWLLLTIYNLIKR